MEREFSWLNQPLQTWFSRAKLKPFPLAPHLDCSACSKSEKAKSDTEKERWKNWKCCTFQPFVPNFLLGAILEERPLPKNQQAAVSPLGLCPTADYRERFFAKPEEARGEDLICGFFDKREHRCSIWKNRPSECSVFFCESSAFYRNRSSDLFEWEIAVAQMALVEHGFSPKEIDDLMAWMDWDDERRLESCWKAYAFRKEKFFISCWKWAKEQTGAEIRSWLSPEVQARFDSWLCFL